MAYVLADPQSKLNFSHDWTDWLASGDLIASRQWSIWPMNAGSPTEPILSQTTSDVVWVEGLETGKIYWLTEQIVTSNGVRDERTIVIRCEQT